MNDGLSTEDSTYVLIVRDTACSAPVLIMTIMPRQNLPDLGNLQLHCPSNATTKFWDVE